MQYVRWGVEFNIVLVFSRLMLFILISCRKHPKVQICLTRMMALFYFILFFYFYKIKKYFLWGCTPNLVLGVRACKRTHKIPVLSQEEDDGNFFFCKLVMKM
jgi:hypothetical protein